VVLAVVQLVDLTGDVRLQGAVILIEFRKNVYRHEYLLDRWCHQRKTVAEFCI
jgi:hypothetical protein